MPTWGEILKEFSTHPNTPDSIRRKYLLGLAEYTGRDIILYSTKWTDPSGINPDMISITEEDIQGFMEVVHGLRNNKLDCIIHSPGGSPAATEAIVKYLRKKFTDIRVIVPQAAMSAGTMLACAGNRILMGKHSFLGPIDPQFILSTHTPGTNRMVPAQAILDQFELAKKECKDNQNLAAWLPILNQYGPGLLIECKNAIALSTKLVKNWLSQYMFKGVQRASHRASTVAKRLAAHQNHKSHSRHLDREDCKEMGLIIDDLEQDQRLQDLVLSVFHASTLTFTTTPAAKIIENQNGKAFIKLAIVGMGRQQPQNPPSSQPQGIPQSAKDVK
jgi:hypothetical protein